MPQTDRRHALLTIIAAQLELQRAEQCLKQYQVGYGKVSPSTAHNVLKGKDHRIGTLVDIADSLDCDVVITLVKRTAENKITQQNESK